MAQRRPVIEVIDDQMVEVLRSRSPAERLEIASGMCRAAREILSAMLSGQHPEWPEERVAAEVAWSLSHGAC